MQVDERGSGYCDAGMPRYGPLPRVRDAKYAAPGVRFVLQRPLISFRDRNQCYLIKLKPEISCLAVIAWRTGNGSGGWIKPGLMIL